jgi:DUF1680 family protein
VADYPLNIYFHAEGSLRVGDPETSGIYISQYIPSRLNFIHAGVPIQLDQQTRYPAEDSITLKLQPEHPVAFTIHLRIPAWLTRAATIKINGSPSRAPAQPGTFTAIRRTWRTGDCIDLTLPQSFRTEPIDEEHPTTVALMRGPVQYVALNPSSQLDREHLTLPAGLKQLAPQSFGENYSGNQIVFVPLHCVRGETYTTYFSRA